MPQESHFGQQHTVAYTWFYLPAHITKCLMNVTHRCHNWSCCQPTKLNAPGSNFVFYTMSTLTLFVSPQHMCWGRQHLLTHVLQTDHSIGLLRETVLPCCCEPILHCSLTTAVAGWGRQHLLTVTCGACCTVMHSSMTMVCWGRQHPTTVTSSAQFRSTSMIVCSSHA